MKSKLYLLLIVCASVLLASCDDATETVDDRWQIDNEAQFARITADPAFTRLESLTRNGHIMYRVIESGDGERSPFFTERVMVHYTGWFKLDWSRPATFLNEQGRLITNKIIFDSTERGGARGMDVWLMISGFSDALQHMVPGDKWEVWIPWHLGYGARAVGNIRPFTTLVFEIEMGRIL
jgi:peptidylprolyl isomerase/FKBP-type peptidyl-prolyl cis-trans isomerase FklB